MKTAGFIIDAPGIGGSSGIAVGKMQAHIDAGGMLMHEVKADGFLAHPETMWPGRDFAGKNVRPDGSTVD